MPEQKNCPVNEKTVNENGNIDQIIENMGMSAGCKRRAHSAVKTLRAGMSAETNIMGMGPRIQAQMNAASNVNDSSEENCGSFAAQFKEVANNISEVNCILSNKTQTQTNTLGADNKISITAFVPDNLNLNTLLGDAQNFVAEQAKAMTDLNTLLLTNKITGQPAADARKFAKESLTAAQDALTALNRFGSINAQNAQFLQSIDSEIIVKINTTDEMVQSVKSVAETDAIQKAERQAKTSIGVTALSENQKSVISESVKNNKKLSAASIRNSINSVTVTSNNNNDFTMSAPTINLQNAIVDQKIVVRMATDAVFTAAQSAASEAFSKFASDQASKIATDTDIKGADDIQEKINEGDKAFLDGQKFKDNPLGMILVAGIALVVVGGGLKMAGGKAAKGKKIMIFLFMMLLGAGLFSLAQLDLLSKISFLSKVQDGIKLVGIAIFTIGLLGLLWTVRPKKETKDEMAPPSMAPIRARTMDPYSVKSSASPAKMVKSSASPAKMVSLGGSGKVFGKCSVSSRRCPSSTRQPRTQNALSPNAVSPFTPFKDIHRLYQPASVNELQANAELARQAAVRASLAADRSQQRLERLIQQAK
jgi:hypothetical protein